MSVGEVDLVELKDSNPPPTLQQQQPHPASSSSSGKASSRKSSRQSPEGREREFPATRVGASAQLQQLSGLQQPPTQQLHRHSVGDAVTMGGGDDRYYHSSGQSSSAAGRCSAAAAAAAAAAGQLGQSRDFHYSVQDHHGSGSGSTGYRTSSSTSSASGRQSGSRSDSGYHHSPHVSTTSRSRSGRDYYLESKASPYHHSSGSSRSSGIRSGPGSSSADRQDPNYAILRQRHQQAAAAAAAAANAAAVAAAAAEYEHRLTHHSGSRSDLLEHDHNAVMYEHGLSSASAYGVPPQTQYTFVRMCDGKFVRTAIPLHDFDSLEGSGYYRMAASSVNHTLRRPTKRHSTAAASALAAAAAAAAGGDNYACCPRVDDLSRSNRAAPATYATLRGQKWAHRQKSGCGVGDNYGRSGGLPYHDESRSVTDDFLALPRAPGDLHHLPQNSSVSLALATNKMVKGGGGLAGNVRQLSRSTDRNLDNLGLDDEEDEDDDLDDDDEDDDDLFPVRTSDEALSLLTREPPDGKEKPEPSKTSMHKMETLSRKSSKCDLMPSSGNGGINTNSNIEAASCRSEATSICGETSSVLSGSTMMGLDRSKADGKRDSLSSGVTNKDAGAGSLFADGILPPPPLSLPMNQDDLDVGLNPPSSAGSDFR